MSYPSRIWSLDPKYGKIHDLCKDLGYASTVKGAPRFWHNLRDKTAKHRQKFMRSSAGSYVFPLDHNALEVRRCAKIFLDNEYRLFEETQEALAFGWPIYPRDDEKILIGLAKLMCTQEWYSKRNNTSPDGKTVCVQEDADPHDADENPNESRGRVFLDWSPSPSPSVDAQFDEAYVDTDQDSDAEERKRVSRIIQSHLDFAYPLVQSRDGMQTDWLFKSDRPTTCPEDIKPYIFRYLHEHQLYSTHKRHLGHLQQFAKALKNHLRVQCSTQDEVYIYQKCKNLVNYHAGKLREGGLLKGDSPVFRRTEEFENAWKARYNFWLTYHNTPDLSGDRVPSAPILAEKRPLSQQSLEKHASDESGRSKSNASIAEPTENTPKRQKVDGGSRLGDRSQQLGTDTMDGQTIPRSIQEGGVRHWSYVENDVDGNSSGETQRQTPTAPMLLTSRNQSITSPLEPAIDGASTSTSQKQPSVLNTSSQTGSSKVSVTVTASQEVPPASIQPKGTVAPNRDSLNLDLLLQKRSTPYGLPGASIRQPGRTPPAIILAPTVSSDLTRSPTRSPTNTLPPSLRSALVSTAQTLPTKPKLQFIIEKQKGILDHDEPISREDWCKYELPEIFALISGKSGQPLASISCLRLSYMWGSLDGIIVKESQSNEDWKKLKARIKKEFFLARKEMPQETDFQIWVKTGDTTIAKEGKEDEDEDW